MYRQQIALLLCIIAVLAFAIEAARTGAAKQVPAAAAHKDNPPSSTSDSYASKEEYYRDSDYSEGYSGETAYRKYGYSNPIMVTTPKKCDFKHGENIHICLLEVSREPSGKVASKEVNYNPQESFNSTFGCCAKGGYLPAETAPIGMCQWTVTEDATSSRVSMGEKLGTVSAVCTVTEDAPCVYPLGPGSKFEIATNVPKTAIWKRMPAAILEKLDYDEGTYPYGAPVKTEGAKDSAQTEYADETYRRRRNRHEEEYHEYERREDEYNSDEREDDYYGDRDGDYYYPSADAIRGKADVYKGLLTAFEGPGSDEVYCGKLEFVADFIDSTGVVRCPVQPDGDPNGYANQFNATDYDSSGPVPVVNCGMYEIMLVKDHPQKHGYRGKYDN